MATYETKFAIGDVVYLATESDVEKKIITRIKISGVKRQVQYGFESHKDAWSMFSCFYSGDSWYSASSLYLKEEAAIAKHENLKLAANIKRAEESQQRKIDKQRELEQQLEDLKNGVEREDWDD